MEECVDDGTRVVARRGRPRGPARTRRCFKNSYNHTFTVEPAAKAKTFIVYVHHVLKTARDLVIASPTLEATVLEVENIRWADVFEESGLWINELDTRDDKRKRAVVSSCPKAGRCLRSW